MFRLLAGWIPPKKAPNSSPMKPMRIEVVGNVMVPFNLLLLFSCSGKNYNKWISSNQQHNGFGYFLVWHRFELIRGNATRCTNQFTMAARSSQNVIIEIHCFFRQNVCSRQTYRTQTYYTATTTVRYTASTTSCGLFGWFRCPATR